MKKLIILQGNKSCTQEIFKIVHSLNDTTVPGKTAEELFQLSFETSEGFRDDRISIKTY